MLHAVRFVVAVVSGSSSESCLDLFERGEIDAFDGVELSILTYDRGYSRAETWMGSNTGSMAFDGSDNMTLAAIRRCSCERD
jgi:hypothetical protein